MRISYVTETYPPEINGVSLSVERCVRFLRERGHAVELIRPRQAGETPRDDAEEWRCAGLALPMYRELRCGLARTSTLCRRFARNRPDLVHVATPGPLGRAAALAAHRLGIPLSTDFRTNFHAYSRYYGLAWLERPIRAHLRRLHNLGWCTFVPSRSVLVTLAADGFERLELLGRGVDTRRFSPAHRDPQLRAEWGVVAENERVLLYVGRLAAEKNVRLALRAHQVVCQQHRGSRLVVVGDGPLRRQLEREFPAARFVGAQRGEALARHYASADLFLFPSESETFGNVTLEAMASGLAVIAFDEAAAGDHILHRRNGFTVPSGDYGGFVEAVRWACEMSDARLTELRCAARDSALRLGWDDVLGRFEHQLLSLRPAPSPAAPHHHVLPA